MTTKQSLGDRITMAELKEVSEFKNWANTLNEDPVPGELIFTNEIPDEPGLGKYAIRRPDLKKICKPCLGTGFAGGLKCKICKGTGKKQEVEEDVLVSKTSQKDYDPYSDYDRAIQDYDQAIRLDPYNGPRGVHNGSYVKDKWGDSEVFKVSQYDPHEEHRAWVADREGRGWYISLDRLVLVTNKAEISKYFGKGRKRNVDEGTPFGGQSPSDICPKCKQKIKDNDLTTTEGFGGMEAHVHCPYKPTEVSEGIADFFIGSPNERAVSKIAKQYGFKNLKKQVGSYTAEILTDLKFENFIVRMYKDSKPVNRIVATGVEELKNILPKVTDMMNGQVNESFETLPTKQKMSRFVKLVTLYNDYGRKEHQAHMNGKLKTWKKYDNLLTKIDKIFVKEFGYLIKDKKELRNFKLGWYNTDDPEEMAKEWLLKPVDESEMHDSDAEKDAMYCDKCGAYHDGPCPDEEGLDAILDQYPDSFNAFLDGGEIDADPAFYEALYQYYTSDTGEMPYGVMMDIY